VELDLASVNAKPADDPKKEKLVWMMRDKQGDEVEDSVIYLQDKQGQPTQYQDPPAVEDSAYHRQEREATYQEAEDSRKEESRAREESRTHSHSSTTMVLVNGQSGKKPKYEPGLHRVEEHSQSRPDFPQASNSNRVVLDGIPEAVKRGSYSKSGRLPPLPSSGHEPSESSGGFHVVQEAPSPKDRAKQAVTLEQEEALFRKKMELREAQQRQEKENFREIPAWPVPAKLEAGGGDAGGEQKPKIQKSHSLGALEDRRRWENGALFDGASQKPAWTWGDFVKIDTGLRGWALERSRYPGTFELPKCGFARVVRDLAECNEWANSEEWVRTTSLSKAGVIAIVEAWTGLMIRGLCAMLAHAHPDDQQRLTWLKSVLGSMEGILQTDDAEHRARTTEDLRAHWGAQNPLAPETGKEWLWNLQRAARIRIEEAARTLAIFYEDQAQEEEWAALVRMPSLFTTASQLDGGGPIASLEATWKDESTDAAAEEENATTPPPKEEALLSNEQEDGLDKDSPTPDDLGRDESSSDAAEPERTQDVDLLPPLEDNKRSDPDSPYEDSNDLPGKKHGGGNSNSHSSIRRQKSKGDSYPRQSPRKRGRHDPIEAVRSYVCALGLSDLGDRIVNPFVEGQLRESLREGKIVHGEVRAGPAKSPERVTAKAALYCAEYGALGHSMTMNEALSTYRKRASQLGVAEYLNDGTTIERRPRYMRFSAKDNNMRWRGRILDFARVSVVFKDPGEVVRTVQQLKEADWCKVVGVFNGFSLKWKPPPSQDRDVRVILKVPLQEEYRFHESEDPTLRQVFDLLRAETVSLKEGTEVLCEVMLLHFRWLRMKRDSRASHKILRSRSWAQCSKAFRKYCSFTVL